MSTNGWGGASHARRRSHWRQPGLREIAAFLGESLDIDRAVAERRERGPECFDGLLELQLIDDA